MGSFIVSQSFVYWKKLEQMYGIVTGEYLLIRIVCFKKKSFILYESRKKWRKKEDSAMIFPEK